jgi:peptidoglycan/xylan/chitin deacetylase (PgdA/CDA1 family)
MLAALMYHRVTTKSWREKHCNNYEMFQEHLMFLKERYPIVLPGDPLLKYQLSLCLTFDDATFDFYHFIFPLLKEQRIRVLLGIPVHYIQDSSCLSPEERLSTPYPLMMQEGFYDRKAPFCTWEELREMVDSGWVEVASHSYLHCNLTFDFVDLKREILLSKEIIEKNLSQSVTSFIYPFGKMTLALQEYVSKHYLYAFRIGSALNFGWGNGSHPLRRLSADNLTSRASPLTLGNLTKALFKTICT